MTEHSPLPWRLKHASADRVLAGDPAEPFTVANCWSGPFAPERHVVRANAALIVRAVNCHDALLANLRLALWHLENPGVPPTADALDDIRAAIARAEGGGR